MPPSAPTGPHLIDFPPFQLDLRGGILRREAAPVALRPKTFAVLQHLAEHPGELVSKQMLLDAVWGDVAVAEEVVRLSIFELHAVASTAPRGSDLADVEYVEELCDGLAGRHEIVRAAGESAWPDGTTTARYAFAHALYRDVIYQSLSSSTRRRLHRAIGERLEQAHGGQTAEAASELAAHLPPDGGAAPRPGSRRRLTGRRARCETAA